VSDQKQTSSQPACQVRELDFSAVLVVTKPFFEDVRDDNYKFLNRNQFVLYCTVVRSDGREARNRPKLFMVCTGRHTQYR
jgi:hypothetical protein